MFTSAVFVAAKSCLRLQYLELDRMAEFTEETAYALCLCGFRGLEAVSFTFTPVTDGAVKQLYGESRVPESRIRHFQIQISHLPLNCSHIVGLTGLYVLTD